MKEPFKALTMAGIAGPAALGMFLTVYHFGHHNIPFSRSYYLEKEIRGLLYLETHEPIDYGLAAETYEHLLSRIRFDETDGDYTKRYEKALERSLKKKQVIDLLQDYQSTGNIRSLHQARGIFQGPAYLELEHYNFSSIWYRGNRLSENWFQKAMEEAGLPGADERS